MVDRRVLLVAGGSLGGDFLLGVERVVDLDLESGFFVVGSKGLLVDRDRSRMSRSSRRTSMGGLGDLVGLQARLETMDDRLGPIDRLDGGL